MRKVSMLLTAAGILLLAYAVVGRFAYDWSVLGFVIKGGMAASSLAIGANSLFLLAILIELLGKKKE